VNITSIVDITGGELQNSPSISFIYNIQTNPKKVNEGDLFIAKKSDDISLALEKGAFGILFDFDTEITDKEVAWIKVDDTIGAIIRFLRFKLSQFELNAFYCDTITYDLIKLYKTSNNNDLILISTNIEKNLEIIQNIENDSFLFCDNQNLLDDIYPENIEFSNKNYQIQNLTEHSLFEISFSYNDQFFSRIKLPSLFLNNFLDVYNFFNKEIDLSKLKNFNHFRPIFIDRYLNITDYGKTDKFIIAQKNYSLSSSQLSFLVDRYKYAKIIFITPPNFPNFSNCQYLYTSLEEIKNILKQFSYNAVFIVGKNYEDIKDLLTNNNDTNKLF